MTPLDEALRDRVIRSVRAVLPGCIEWACADDGPRVLFSLRAGAVGCAVRASDDGGWPDDLGRLTRGEPVRARESRAEFAAMREAVEDARVVAVDALAGDARVVELALLPSGARVVLELLPRAGRLVLLDEKRVVRAVLDPPSHARAGAPAIGSVYSPPPPRHDVRSADAQRTPHDLITAIVVSLRTEAADDVRALLTRAAKRLDKREASIREALAASEDAPHTRRRAETILAHITRVPRGAGRVRLPDVYTNEEVEIALDPLSSAQENAERLFRRARKAERAEPVERARLDEVMRARAEVTSLLDALGDRSAPPPALDAIAHVAAHARGVAARLGVAVDRAAPAAPVAARPVAQQRSRFAPRRFRTTDGWDVLVGRTNEENDWLSLKHARPEDIWMHVHGAAGSHVVLRRAGRKDNPSRRTLEEAASFAAFYSKAKNAGKVPVIYTEAKYVRKPRKSPPGQVTCTREKTLIVRPAEPTAAQKTTEAGDV